MTDPLNIICEDFDIITRL